MQTDQDNTIVGFATSASDAYYNSCVATCAIDNDTTLGDCFTSDGTIDLSKYRTFLDEEEEAEAGQRAWIASQYPSDEEENVSGTGDTSNSSSKKKRIRLSKSLKPYFFDDNGEVVYLEPRQTYWYLAYVKNPPVDDSKWQVKFRRRF